MSDPKATRALRLLDDLAGAPEKRTTKALALHARTALGFSSEDAHLALAWLKRKGYAAKVGRPIGRGGHEGKAWELSVRGRHAQAMRRLRRVERELRELQ